MKKGEEEEEITRKLNGNCEKCLLQYSIEMVNSSNDNNTGNMVRIYIVYGRVRNFGCYSKIRTFSLLASPFIPFFLYQWFHSTYRKVAIKHEKHTMKNAKTQWNKEKCRRIQRSIHNHFGCNNTQNRGKEYKLAMQKQHQLHWLHHHRNFCNENGQKILLNTNSSEWERSEFFSIRYTYCVLFFEQVKYC